MKSYQSTGWVERRSMGGWKGGEAVMQFHRLEKVLPGPQNLAEPDIWGAKRTAKYVSSLILLAISTLNQASQVPRMVLVHKTTVCTVLCIHWLTLMNIFLFQLLILCRMLVLKTSNLQESSQECTRWSRSLELSVESFKHAVLLIMYNTGLYFVLNIYA